MNPVALSTKQATLAFNILELCEEAFPEEHEIPEVLPVLKVIFEAIQETIQEIADEQ